jgi:hypothetical protein
MENGETADRNPPGRGLNSRAPHAGRHQFVPLILAGKGRATNSQNELGEQSEGRNPKFEIRSSKFEGLEEDANPSNDVVARGRGDGGWESERRMRCPALGTNEFFFLLATGSWLLQIILVGATSAPASADARTTPIKGDNQKLEEQVRVGLKA